MLRMVLIAAAFLTVLLFGLSIIDYGSWTGGVIGVFAGLAFYAILYLDALLLALYFLTRGRRRMALGLVGAVLLVGIGVPVALNFQQDRTEAFAEAAQRIPAPRRFDGRNVLFVSTLAHVGCRDLCSVVVKQHNPASVALVRVTEDALEMFAGPVDLSALPGAELFVSAPETYRGLSGRAGSIQTMDEVVFQGDLNALAPVLGLDMPYGTTLSFLAVPVGDVTRFRLSESQPDMIFFEAGVMRYGIPFMPVNRRYAGHPDSVDLRRAQSEVFCPGGAAERIDRDCRPR